MFTELEKRFQEQCEGLEVDPSALYLIAVSGGVDSMVLLHLCKAAGINGLVVHANFQLRGEASDQDARFVEKAARSLGFAFQGTSFPTEQVARGKGLSIQMAARMLRYEWFGQCCKEHRAAGLLTGHHLQDAVETFFIHFIRGTGVSGLAGIPVKSHLKEWQVTVFRPMSNFTRSEIAEYARSNGIQWREDQSNNKTDYERNRIRLEVLPPLEAMKPAFWETSRQTLEHLRSQDSNYQYLIQKQLVSAENQSGSFEIRYDRLLALPSPSSGLWEVLHPHGFTAEQVRQMLLLLESPGKSFLSSTGVRVITDRNCLLVQPSPDQPIAQSSTIHLEEDDLLVRLPAGGRLILTDWEPGAGYPTDSNSVVVDRTVLRYPLKVRNWQAGDRFQPFGMEGRHKKLQDFFTDLKLNIVEKEAVQVLVNGDQQVIWVIGYRLDHRFRVKSTSKEMKKISWLK